MTDSEWQLVRQWLLHGEGALLSADELVELMRPEKLKALAAELRVSRFVSRHRGSE